MILFMPVDHECVWWWFLEKSKQHNAHRLLLLISLFPMQWRPLRVVVKSRDLHLGLGGGREEKV